MGTGSIYRSLSTNIEGRIVPVPIFTDMKRTMASAPKRRFFSDSRGVTLIEIIIGLMILSLGVVGILALFPKALHTTNRVMQITTGSMVARSAMAMLLYDCEDGDIGDLVEWITGYGTDGVWPDAINPTHDFIGSVDNPVTFSTPSSTIPVTGLSTGYTITNYFLLVTSGRARGRLYPIGTGSTTTSIKIIGTASHPVDVRKHDLEQGDSFEIIGPNCVGQVFRDPAYGSSSQDSDLVPARAIIFDDGGSAEKTLYTWIAVVNGDDPNMDGFHKVTIFVYGKDYTEIDDTSLTEAERFKTIRDHKPAYYFVTAITEQGTP